MAKVDSGGRVGLTRDRWLVGADGHEYDNKGVFMARDNEKIIEILVSTKRCLREKLAALAMAEAAPQTLRGFTEVMLILESISESIGENRSREGDIEMSEDHHGQRFARVEDPRVPRIIGAIEEVHQRLNQLLERVDQFEKSRIIKTVSPNLLTDIELHRCLDLIVALFLEDYPNRDAKKAPLWDLIKWSSDRAQIPAEGTAQ